MSLKELTSEAHRNAERQAFVKEMFSGNMDPTRYAEYLFNLHSMYDILERVAMGFNIFSEGLEELKRSDNIAADYRHLMKEEINQSKFKLKPVVKAYTRHLLNNVQMDKQKTIAHVYVRHMGDLSGGQMLKSRVPGPGLMYDFIDDPEVLKTKIRALINDSMAEEANICFDFSTQLFKEMSE